MPLEPPRGSTFAGLLSARGLVIAQAGRSASQAIDETRAALGKVPLDAAFEDLRPGTGQGFTLIDLRSVFPEARARALFEEAKARCAPPVTKIFPIARSGRPVAESPLPASVRAPLFTVVDWLAAEIRARLPEEQPILPALAELQVISKDSGHHSRYRWHHDGHWLTATLALVGPSTTLDHGGQIITPETGSVVLFSGANRAAAIPGVRATWHNAPPGYDRGPLDEDRLALMIFFRRPGAQPRSARDRSVAARPRNELDREREGSA